MSLECESSQSDLVIQCGYGRRAGRYSSGNTACTSGVSVPALTGVQVSKVAARLEEWRSVRN